MFKIFKKVEECGTKINEVVERVNELVFCEECKMVLFERDAQKVSNKHTGAMCSSSFSSWYCPAHKKPYDVVVDSIGGRFYKKFIPETPAKTILVDEKGREIK